MRVGMPAHTHYTEAEVIVTLVAENACIEECAPLLPPSSPSPRTGVLLQFLT